VAGAGAAAKISNQAEQGIQHRCGEQIDMRYANVRGGGARGGVRLRPGVGIAIEFGSQQAAAGVFDHEQVGSGGIITLGEELDAGLRAEPEAVTRDEHDTPGMTDQREDSLVVVGKLGQREGERGPTGAGIGPGDGENDG